MSRALPVRQSPVYQGLLGILLQLARLRRSPPAWAHRRCLAGPSSAQRPAPSGLLLPAWYFRQRSERRRAEAVDALRDAARVGAGIEEALRVLARTGPRPLRAVFRDVDRDCLVSVAAWSGATVGH